MMKEENKDEEKKEEVYRIKAVSIPLHKRLDEAIFYVINVTSTRDSWSVSKRYSQFEEFHSTLCGGALSHEIPVGVDLPGKKIKFITSHTDPHFVEERRCLLEAYLTRLSQITSLSQSDLFINFLSEDKKDVVDEEEEEELPDDVEVTDVSIPATRSMSDHVLFQIDVVNCRKRKTYSKWTVLKRFGQFFDMDTALRSSLQENDPYALDLLPPAPQRRPKLLFDHMDEGFVEQRRVLLENYLKRMLRVLPVARNEEFLSFLGVT